MANKNSNYPANAINNLPADVTSDTFDSILELASKGKPNTQKELEKRINDYFSFCKQHNFKCGIESLSMALGVSRTTFWQWVNGRNCTREWAETCQNAKQVIIAFLEALMLSGKLNPASSIFLLKNIAGYSDTYSFEGGTPDIYKGGAKTLEDIKRERLQRENERLQSEEV